MAIVHITTAQQLQDMNLDPTGDYVLDNDIDCSSIPYWIPVGYGNWMWNNRGVYGQFTGTFDGQGFTIRNLHCDDDYNFDTWGMSGNCAGLFGFVGNDRLRYDTVQPIKKASIKNVTLENFSLRANYAAGACAGFIIGADIDNVHVVNITVEGTQYNGYWDATALGGLAGDCYSIRTGGYPSPDPYSYIPSSIKNCDAIGVTITKGNSEIGGLLGDFYNYDTFDNFTVENCFAKNVNIEMVSRPYAIGGFSGASYGKSFNCYAENVIITQTDGLTDSYVGGFSGDCNGEFTDCSVDGLEINIVGSNDDVGDTAGFAGEAWEGFFENCYAIGSITVTGTYADVFASILYIGGFAGDVSSGTRINKCYADVTISINTDISGTGYLYDLGIGGFVGEVADADTIIENCYARGNVTRVGAAKTGMGTAGFCGTLDGGWMGEASPTFRNCYCTGNVEGNGSVGGFVGENEYYGIETVIENCFSIGVVTGHDQTQTGQKRGVGGFIGCNLSNSNFVDGIINCAWWRGAHEHAIGYEDDIETFRALLATDGRGIDEPDKLTFMHKEHAVYAQV